MDGSEQEGTQKLGSDTPSTPPLSALLADEGVQTSWQAAAPASQCCLLTASRENQVWHCSLFGKSTATPLCTAACHQVLPKETYTGERNYYRQ